MVSPDEARDRTPVESVETGISNINRSSISSLSANPKKTNGQKSDIKSDMGIEVNEVRPVSFSCHLSCTSVTRSTPICASKSTVWQFFWLRRKTKRTRRSRRGLETLTSEEFGCAIFWFARPEIKSADRTFTQQICTQDLEMTAVLCQLPSEKPKKHGQTFLRLKSSCIFSAQKKRNCKQRHGDLQDCISTCTNIPRLL